MIVNYVEEHFDLEEEERINQILIAIRYVGPKSSKPVGDLNRSAAWPSFSPLQGGEIPDGEDADKYDREPGPPQGAVIPDWTDEDVEDRSVEALESDPDIEVYYAPSAIAECMLESNYLDPNIFGQGFDPDLRDFVFDALGLEDIGVRKEAEYRDQLREVAGVEADDTQRQQELRDDSRVSEYRQGHPRSELKEAATILGFDGDDNAGKLEFAEYLADQPAAAVRFAFEGKVQAALDAQAGDEPDDAEPLTPDDVVEGYEYDEIKTVVKKVREGTGEFSLKGAGEADMAAFLVEDKGLTESEIDAELTE